MNALLRAAVELLERASREDSDAEREALIAVASATAVRSVGPARRAAVARLAREMTSATMDIMMYLRIWAPAGPSDAEVPVDAETGIYWRNEMAVHERGAPAAPEADEAGHGDALAEPETQIVGLSATYHIFVRDTVDGSAADQPRDAGRCEWRYDVSFTRLSRARSHAWGLACRRGIGQVRLYAGAVEAARAHARAEPDAAPIEFTVDV